MITKTRLFDGRQRSFSIVLTLCLICSFHSNSTGQEKTQFFFKEDVSVAKNPRENMVKRQATPNTWAAAEDFQRRIGGASSASFEEFGSQTDEKRSDFHLDFAGGVTADLTGMHGLHVVEPGKTFNGGFPTHGNNVVLIMSRESDSNRKTTAQAKIKFNKPQAAFGFCATDIEKNTITVELVRPDGSTESYTPPVTIPQNSGGCCFIGMINKTRPFTEVRFYNKGRGMEGFGFDEMMIAEPQLVAISTVIVDANTFYKRQDYKGCFNLYEKTAKTFLSSTKISQVDRSRLELALKQTGSMRSRCSILRSAFQTIQYSQTCTPIINTAIREGSTFFASNNFESCWNSYHTYATKMLDTTSISTLDRQRLEMALAYKGDFRSRCTQFKQTFEYLQRDITNSSLFLKQTDFLSLQWSKYFVVSMRAETGRTVRIESSDDNGKTWFVSQEFTGNGNLHRYIDHSNDHLNSAHRLYRAQYIN